MARVYTKPGDVFSVKLGNCKKYFQYIANDLTQLNSDVIRGFKKQYDADANPDLLEIISDEVDFYAHCIVKFGVKMDLWEKVGTISDVGSLTTFLFRGSSDSGVKVGEQTVKISERWYVWKINDKDFIRVGKLTGQYKKAFIGVVVIPQDIVDYMKDGKYRFVYPGFK